MNRHGSRIACLAARRKLHRRAPTASILRNLGIRAPSPPVAPGRSPPRTEAQRWSSLSLETASSELPGTRPRKPPCLSGRNDVSLARYPNLRTAGGMLRGADYAGTVTFALTGTITAAQSGLDVFGCCLVGILTSVGGGTIRDSILLNKRPFWTEEPEYIWMGLATGLVAFFAWPTSVLEWKRREQQKRDEETRQRQRDGTPAGSREEPSPTDRGGHRGSGFDAIDVFLESMDAIGLSAFCIIGAQNGIRAGMPPVVSAICGMATATFGGVLRDVLCGRPVRIVHSNTEVYAPPALAGAAVYLAAGSGRIAGLRIPVASPLAKIGLATATCLGGRYVAIANDVKLHTWDTAHDNLGVTIRKKPTQNRNYRNRD